MSYEFTPSFDSSTVELTEITESKYGPFITVTSGAIGVTDVTLRLETASGTADVTLWAMKDGVRVDHWYVSETVADDIRERFGGYVNE